MARIIGTSAADIFDGTTENDYITGEFGDDIINASEGDDRIDGYSDFPLQGRYSSDYFDNGFDVVFYDYAPEDLVFELSGIQSGAIDGFTVTKPDGSMDTLDNIEALQFSDGQTVLIGELVEGVLDVRHDGSQLGSIGQRFTTYGSIGDDAFTLFGTTVLPPVPLDEPNTEFVGIESAGNDTITGSSDARARLNQMDYLGFSTDYEFTENDDGSVSVLKPNGGTDTLINIDGAWFATEGAWYSLDELTTPTGGSAVVGTGGDDYLTGTAGDNVIYMLGGNDVVLGSEGNDRIFGATDGNTSDYDQIDYEGSAGDYTFTRLESGEVEVTKPDGGVDIISNIDGIWFRGEEAWYRITDLFDGDNAVIYGTDSDDYLFGTEGNDEIYLFAGQDTVRTTTGDDTIVGQDNSYDQVDYYGAPSDYSFARNEDGSISVFKPDGGEDTLVSIDGFWFFGSEEWISAATIAPLA